MVGQLKGGTGRVPTILAGIGGGYEENLSLNGSIMPPKLDRRTQ